MAKFHIGKKIKEIWKQSRLKGTEFAEAIDRDRQVIYDIFKRESIDTELLRKISQVLNYNFFSHYSQALLTTNEPKGKYGFATKDELEQLSLSLHSLVKKEMTELKQELAATAKPQKIRSTKKKY